MRIRVEYSLGPELRFLSNLDTMHMMERALRRAKIPFALSEGFNPHIRLSMGTVLPVGLWGLKEYFDLELREETPSDQVRDRLNRVLPEAVCIRRAAMIANSAPSLMKVVNCACYGFDLHGGSGEMEVICRRILQAASLPVKSRGKKKEVDKDLRKGIYKIDIQAGQPVSHLMIWVAAGEPVNIRYDELMDLFEQQGLNDIVDVYREGNYIWDGEQFFTPLEG